MEKFDQQKVAALTNAAIQNLIDMAKTKPNCAPLFIVYVDADYKGVGVIPVANLDGKDISMICKLIVDPQTKRYDRIVFTDPQNEN